MAASSSGLSFPYLSPITIIPPVTAPHGPPRPAKPPPKPHAILSAKSVSRPDSPAKLASIACAQLNRCLKSSKAVSTLSMLPPCNVASTVQLGRCSHPLAVMDDRYSLANQSCVHVEGMSHRHRPSPVQTVILGMLCVPVVQAQRPSLGEAVCFICDEDSTQRNIFRD